MGVKRRCVAAMAVVLLALGWVATADAASMRVAVLELSNRAGFTDDEAYYLTDLVRGAASRTLSGDSFIVMTRENITELLPADVDLSKCTDAECEVEIGQMIGADYIVTGEIIKFAGEYRIILKGHHVSSGAFLGEQTAEGKTLRDLEKSARGISNALSQRVNSHAGVSPATKGPGFKEGEIGEAGEVWVPGVGAEVIVRFESDPTGAMVEIGDQPVCEAPCSRALRLGNHDVAMKKLKWVTKRSAVEVKGGMETVSWKLEPDFGWLTVRSNPSGLDISINGKVEGKTPITRREMAPSRYEVLVTDSRHYDQGKRIRIERGEDEVVDVELKPRQGGIKVEAKDKKGNAVEGDVYVDGQNAGRTYEPISHIIGTHEVEVRSGQGHWSGNVIVEEKKVATVDAKVTEEGSPTLTAKEWYKRGKNARDDDEKIKAYTKVIALDPKNAYAYFYRGLAYGELGNYQQVIKDYDKAIALDPKDSWAYYNRGLAYMLMGNYQQAIKDYDKAIALDPKDSWAYNNRGWAYVKLGNNQQAIKDSDKAIELDPKNASAYNTRGVAYENMSNYQQAIKDYNKAIALDPKLDDTYYHRGRAYGKLGNDQQKAADYKAAARLGYKDAQKWLTENGYDW
ncbi:tetratricopeptide repeat protein [Thermodesulfobacteriota bacterium]